MLEDMESKVLPPIVGSIIKIAVSAELGKDVHMKDVDFSCVIYNDSVKSNSVTLTKSEMVFVEDDLYLAVVDTKDIGSGEYYMQFTVDIPDTDCPEQMRREIVSLPTGIKVNFK